MGYKLEENHNKAEKQTSKQMTCEVNKQQKQTPWPLVRERTIPKYNIISNIIIKVKKK
jgi:hypothetical protein